MKILYLTNSIPTPTNSMVGIFNLRRINELKRLGNEVDVASINNILKRNDSIQFKFNYRLSGAGYKDQEVFCFNNLKVPGFLSWNFLYLRLYRFIKKNRYDLIHAHLVEFGFHAAILKKKFHIPYILTVHGTDIHTRPFQSEKLKIRALQALENADHVIFVSQYLEKKSREFGFSKSNFSIIPNGIENHLLEIKHNPVQSTRIVGFVGNLFTIKGADRLPDICDLILVQNKNVQFLIIGDGYLFDKLKKRFSELQISNKVTMTGQVQPEEIKEYMSQMDILMLPSLNEGWGCVIIEAHAVGTLVIGSANGAIPEAVGDKQYIVSDDKSFIENFAQKVCYYLDQGYDRQPLRERARTFTWEKLVKEEDTIYKQVIKKVIDNKFR